MDRDDEMDIANRGAAAINAAIKEWSGKPVATPEEWRQFAIFMFSKGAAYGVEEVRRIDAENA